MTDSLHTTDYRTLGLKGIELYTSPGSHAIHKTTNSDKFDYLPIHPHNRQWLDWSELSQTTIALEYIGLHTHTCISLVHRPYSQLFNVARSGIQ